MEIDRSNYEIWFTDWNDGNLNSLQIDQLKVFLSENPDLREEFNDFNSMNLFPSAISFNKKEHLKKSPSDISRSQFDYLCAAYVENDLSGSQQTELKEIIDMYPDKKKTFDLIQKTRLVPPKINYKHKDLLLKRTAFQKIIRFSIIGLSAAAAVALLIVAYSVIPGNTSLNNNRSAENVVSDSTYQKPSLITVPDRIFKDNGSVPAEQKNEKSLANFNKTEPVYAHSDLETALSDDSLVRKNADNDITVNKVPVYTRIDLKKEIISNTLVASNTTIYVPDVEEDRSDLGRFISKTFREKLLKEKTPPDSPLKGYEIAEAGVTGLNKLFGWEMALDKKNDDNGQLKSVYFSSKILKFNAPVKKSEPSE
jgi:hypothetical protein